mmetsp:Transcript_35763/g.101215  ORF Transcript_35763/g.101215 Transcript_35763/m.101215 type:complete len:276 (+) Transcript_35763:1317-2144(+)
MCKLCPAATPDKQRTCLGRSPRVWPSQRRFQLLTNELDPPTNASRQRFWHPSLRSNHQPPRHRASPPSLPPLPVPTPVSFWISEIKLNSSSAQQRAVGITGSPSLPEASEYTKLPVSNAAEGATKKPESANQTPKPSPELSPIMKTSQRFVGILLAGSSSDLRTLFTSTSQLSMCFTTNPVSLLNTCFVPPAAASRGFQGRSMTQLNRHLTSTLSSDSFQSRMSSCTSSRYAPRLDTFCLKRSTPLNETNGSLNSQLESYADMSPCPLTKYLFTS